MSQPKSHNIKHKVGIKATANEIYKALTTNQGLSAWWTDDVTGAGEVGAVIAFRFNGGGPDFQVKSLIENKQVIWAHRDSMPDAWAGTEIVFDIEEAESTTNEGQCFVHFQHRNWQSDDAFFAHCNTRAQRAEDLAGERSESEGQAIIFKRSCEADFCSKSKRREARIHKRAVFLLSLKDYLETGIGKPFPHDIQIDHN